jgi:hypothetical protein
VRVVECPAMAAISSMGTPASLAMETKVCRSSRGIRDSPSPAAFVSRRMDRLTLCESMSVPMDVVNTRLRPGEVFTFGAGLGEQGVVEPGAVVGELVVGQDAGGGPAVFPAGPLVAGAVQAGRVGVAAAPRVAAARHPAGEAGADLGSDAGGPGLLGRCGRHALIVAARVPQPAHFIKHKYCAANDDAAACIGQREPSSVSPQAAAFAQDVIA